MFSTPCWNSSSTASHFWTTATWISHILILTPKINMAANEQMALVKNNTNKIFKYWYIFVKNIEYWVLNCQTHTQKFYRQVCFSILLKQHFQKWKLCLFQGDRSREHLNYMQQFFFFKNCKKFPKKCRKQEDSWCFCGNLHL